MKIYRNEQGIIVIDGENITKVTVPQIDEPVSEWVKNRITLPGEEVLIINFQFYCPNLSSEHVTEPDR
jgi:hypothetical protein